MSQISNYSISTTDIESILSEEGQELDAIDHTNKHKHNTMSIKRRVSVSDIDARTCNRNGFQTEPEQRDSYQCKLKKRPSSSGAGIGSKSNDSASLAGLDNYIIISRIGEGAFSTVYHGCDKRNGRDVAIKTIRKTHLNRMQSAGIRKEVELLASLNHPNIIKLLDFHETNESYNIMTELGPGGELFDRVLDLTYLSERLARHVIIQVGEAVRYLHQNGIVQRDIKLENVVFEPIPVIPSSAAERPRAGDTEPKQPEGVFVPGIGGGGIGRVKLIDFGLSKVVWNQSTHTPCGTAGYAAPEIVRDEFYTKSVDIWGLGCMLYALICGFPPFYDEAPEVLTRKVAMGQYEFLSPWWDGVDMRIKHLISHLLDINPQRRYTISDFMRHPWIVEGIDEMCAPRAALAAGIGSIDRRRPKPDTLRMPHYAHRRHPMPSAVASPRERMRYANDLAYAMCRLDNDAVARQRYANTPAWESAFGAPQDDYGFSLAHRQHNANLQGVHNGAVPKTPGWNEIRALGSPLQLRHCWQGTMGSPCEIQAAEADFNLISQALNTEITAEKPAPSSATPSLGSDDLSAESWDSSGSKFELNMNKATLLKRRQHA